MTYENVEPNKESNPTKMIRKRLQKLEKQEILTEIKRIAREKLEIQRIEILHELKSSKQKH